MNVAMVGAGRVGLVAAAGLAGLGTRVHCLDLDRQCVESLRHMLVPFHEPGIGELVRKGFQAGRL